MPGSKVLFLITFEKGLFSLCFLVFVGVVCVCVCKGEVEGGTIDSSADFFFPLDPIGWIFEPRVTVTHKNRNTADFINY